MRDYKLVAIDIDDTLLSDQLILSEEIKVAIKAAIELGVKVTLATGRMYASALPYAQQLELENPIITYNGALVKNPISEQIFYHRPIALPVAKELANLAEAEDWHLNIYSEDQLYVNKLGAEIKEYEKIAGIKANLIEEGLEDFLVNAPTKLLILAANLAETKKIIGDLKSRFGAEVHITRSKDKFVEIMGQGVSKGVALADLAAELQIKSEEVIAIGDSLNDLEMIEWAGLGVAVANADSRLKQSADYIASSNEEGGVVEVIRKFVLSELQ